jgi:alcohol dehydrogenase class IV
MNFQFATANKIIFGNGVLKLTAPLAKEIGAKALVISGRSIERTFLLLEQLQVHRIKYATFSISGEPTIESIDAALQKARNTNVDIIISFGGGSVIDAGKAVAALINNPGDVLDYLEVIGKGKKLSKNPLPHIAIPTTAGTGTEVTKNAVLRSEAHNVKVSLRHDLMIPTAAIIDPELTYSMPPDITASTGMDALTQLIEPFVCNQANPMTDALCREGISRAARSLKAAFCNGADKTAREDMAIASLFGGIALANAKLGAVHGFAGPIGGMFDAPHGAVCARLLPFVVEENISALKERQPNSPILARYAEIAQLLTARTDAQAADGIEWLFQLLDKLAIPSLSMYGLQKKDVEAVVTKSQNASSMKGNPIQLTKKELADILEKSLKK